MTRLKLLFICIVLSIAANAQKTKTISFGSGVDTITPRVLTSIRIIPKSRVDTIKSYLMCFYKPDAERSHGLAFGQYGYLVYSVTYSKKLFGDVKISYLDQNKVPLSDNVIVWESKEMAW